MRYPRTTGGFLAAILLFTGAIGYAESLRGPVVSMVELDVSKAPEVSFELGLEDIASVSLTGDLRFLQGVQLEVQVPDTARGFPGSFGLYLYKNVTPTPTSGLGTYSAARAFFDIVPSGNRFFVTIPLRTDHTLRQTADSYLVKPPIDSEDFPLLVTIYPVMKGLSRSATNSRFNITAKPLLVDRGALRLRITDPQGVEIQKASGALREFTVLLDGSTIEYGDEDFILTPGLHKLVLESPRYENQSMTFGVERGKVTNVALELTEPVSTVKIDAPEGTQLFVDGARVEKSPLQLPPGEHTLLFKLGDYTISRRLTVEAKKNYKISLSLNILINED